MNILICSEFYFPQVGGVEEHNFQISNYFHKLGHHVELVTSFNKNRKTKNNLIKVNQFKIYGNLVKGYSGETLNYQNFLLKNKFDIIFVNAAQQWTCDLLLPIIKDIKAKKIFFPCGFSRLNNILYIPYFKLLKNLINYFDAIVCVSKNYQDYKFIKENYKKKIHIIENGASIIKPIYSKDEFEKKYNINKYDKIICNISNIKFLKGQDRVISILREIKKKNIKIFLIGNNMSSLYYLYIKIIVFLFNKNQNDKKIIFLSPKRDEALTILHYSDIFIFGSRTEYDPLVIKEAMLASKKFISYDVGIINKYAKLGFGFCSKNKKKLITKLEKFLQSGHTYYKPNKINIYNWDNVMVKYAKIFQYL